MGKTIRVILADDHELVLDGLKLRLADTDDIKVVAAVDNGTDLLTAIEIHQPDIVVMDLHMPGMDGFTVLEQIRSRSLPVRVLVLTALADGESLQRAVALDADGIVLKTESPRQTVEAIRQVAIGQVVFPRSVHKWLLRRAKRQEAGQSNGRPIDMLSDRERDVLKLIAEGKTNQEIAADLLLSTNTVKYHLQNLYRKLRVNNRTEATRIYLQNKNQSAIN